MNAPYMAYESHKKRHHAFVCFFCLFSFISYVNILYHTQRKQHTPHLSMSRISPPNGIVNAADILQSQEAQFVIDLWDA